MRYLIRMPNWLGDFIMALPVLDAIKKSDPNAWICARMKKEFVPLAEACSQIDQINILNQDAIPRCEVAILLTNSFSSAYELLGKPIQRKIGYQKDWRSFLLTDKIPWPKESTHQVQSYLNLLKPLGIDVPMHMPPTPLFFTQEERQELVDRFQLTKDRPMVAICAHAAYGPAKCWPLEKYGQLIGKLLEQEMQVVLVGNQEAREIYEQTFSFSNLINAAGKTTLKELAALLSLADVTIANDSGPMHLSAQVGTRTVAIFGSTDPKRTAPLHNTHVLYEQVSCSPCFKRTCPIDFRCMHKISVEQVFQTIKAHQYA